MKRGTILLLVDQQVEKERPGLLEHVGNVVGVSFAVKVETRVQDAFPADRVRRGEVDIAEGFGFPDWESLDVGDASHVVCVTGLHLVFGGGRLEASVSATTEGRLSLVSSLRATLDEVAAFTKTQLRMQM